MKNPKRVTALKKLKALGITVVATVALSASMASAAQADSFNAAKYPATVAGSSTGDVFTMFGSTFKCTENTFTSSLASASTTLSITPYFQNCKMGFFPMTWNPGTAKFNFSTSKSGTSRTMSIVGGAIKLNIYASNAAKEAGTPMCELTIPEQGPLQGNLAYTNVGNDIYMTGGLNSIKVTQVRKSAYCASGTETTTASYSIQSGGIRYKGTNGGVENQIWVG